MIFSGREPKSSLGWVFNSKSDHIAIMCSKCMAWHAATSTVENSDQGLSCQLMFVHAWKEKDRRKSTEYSENYCLCQPCNLKTGHPSVDRRGKLLCSGNLAIQAQLVKARVFSINYISDHHKWKVPGDHTAYGVYHPKIAWHLISTGLQH